MSRTLKLSVAAGLVFLAALYVAWPYGSVRGLAGAVREHDGSRISAYVDLPAVRESLKAQADRMLGDLEKRAPRPGTGEVVIGRVGPFVVRDLVPPLLDRVLTDEAVGGFVESDAASAVELVRMVRGPAAPVASSVSPAPAELVADPSAEWLERIVSMRFRSPLHFTVQLQSGWILHLAPSGTRWRVYDVELPDDLLKS
jgi:hypothetical protein